VEAPGHKGLAFKKKDGSYGWPIVDRRDLLNAIKAWGRARPSERLAVKAFIKKRAVLLRLEELLPSSWQLKVPASTKTMSPMRPNCDTFAVGLPATSPPAERTRGAGNSRGPALTSVTRPALDDRLRHCPTPPAPRLRGPLPVFRTIPRERWIHLAR
jgi:hypothetical protein